MSELSRLRWRCRRGIREMDLLLERFLDRCYPTLDHAQRAAFDHLLAEADLDIYSWITGRVAPPEPAYGPIVQRLREIYDDHTD